MKEQEIKALVSLLDDDDKEITTLIEKEIRQRGEAIIPFLEIEYQEAGFNPRVQQKIEELIHDLQFEQVLDRIANWRNGGGMNLLEGLWAVATYQYPDLTFEKLKYDFEQIYYEAWLEFKPEMHPVDQIKTLNHVFYDTLKFGSNTKNFHSASNSMINIVLESRRGNPISLCCLYMLIAQKLKMPVYGVNLPNLFILTYKQDNVQFYINVFNKGLVFMKADIDHFVGQLNLKPIDSFYEPCTNIDIVKRMMRNLALAFERTSDNYKAKDIEKMVRTLLDLPTQQAF
jgi:regulator of sirC expression with transglutaminase-like and TPR domain